MFEIFIDCTDRNKSIIRLLKDKSVIDEVYGDVDVVSSIVNIIKINNLQFKNISRFCMNEGPGSFTGLKISASIVNALNYALGVTKPGDEIRPIYEASKFDAVQE